MASERNAKVYECTVKVRMGMTGKNAQDAQLRATIYLDNIVTNAGYALDITPLALSGQVASYAEPIGRAKRRADLDEEWSSE